MEPMTIPIACVQISCTPFDRIANLDKADEAIGKAAAQGARLILLPEFLPTGSTWDWRLLDLAEPLGGPTSRWIQNRSRKTGCWIGAGILERAAEAVFDTFLLVGPTGEIHSYRKHYPAFFEMLLFHRGRTVGIFDTALGRIGLLVCWDMVHARLWKAMAGQIDLLLICSAWPAAKTGNLPIPGFQGWLDRQPVHMPKYLAKTLDVPVAYCNMTGPFISPIPYLGFTYRAQFPGSSSITESDGTTIAAAGSEEIILLGEVRPRVETVPRKAS